MDVNGKPTYWKIENINVLVRRAFYVQNKRSSQLRAFKWNYWRSPLGENQEIYSGCNHSPQRRLLRASIASTSKDGRIQEVITISGAIEAVIEFDDGSEERIDLYFEYFDLMTSTEAVTAGRLMHIANN
ncbi:12898_t:CDS:2 [Rhizophagus irregularis]|nr:12898_t:CDS:2 [Rhizophagus irregularis]